MLVLNAAAQSAFRTSTLNTVLKSVTLKDIYDSSGSDNLSWLLSGEIVKNPNSENYCFYSDTEIETREYLHGETLKKLVVVLYLATDGTFGPNSNYNIILEYEDGSFSEKKTGISSYSPEYKNYEVSFNDIKPMPFKIKIKSNLIAGGYVTYIKDIIVKARFVPSIPKIEVSPTSMKIPFDSNFDFCVVNLSIPEKLKYNVDTLYNNDFEDNDLKGAVSVPDYLNKTYPFYNVGPAQNLRLSIPLMLSGINDSLRVSFKVRKLSERDTSSVKVLYNGEVVKSFSKRKYKVDVWYKEDFIFLPKESFANLEFFCSYGVTTGYLLLDDVIISQNSKYKYCSLEGFPKQVVDEDCVIDNLSCNTEYRLQIQYNKNTNDFGEEVITDIREYFVKTTGESIVLKPGEDKDMNGDFYGSIMMGNNSNLNGKLKVMGEFCYLFEYEQGHWESLTLPFKPYLVGAFINGEPVYLRENIDFHLHEYVYSSDDDKYKFLPSTDMKEYVGYLLKVPENIKYDDNVLFFYSDKKISLNDDRKYNLDGLLFAQLGNPYTYSLGDDAWNVFGYDCIYKYDGNKFVLFTVNDIIKPFESVIIYTGSPNTMPKYISIEDEVTSLEDGFIGVDVLMAVYNNAVSFYNYIGYIKIYDINGLLIYDDYISDGSQLYLEHGIYIVEFNGFKRKIVI